MFKSVRAGSESHSAILFRSAYGSCANQYGVLGGRQCRANFAAPQVCRARAESGRTRADIIGACALGIDRIGALHEFDRLPFAQLVELPTLDDVAVEEDIETAAFRG